MFHISNDKRALDSAVQLRNGLEDLLNKHPFQTITVSQLCAQSDVSRSTFYRLFDTPADIIHWTCDEAMLVLIDAYQSCQKENHSWPFQFNLRFILEHPGPLELACRANRIDIADAAFQRHMQAFLAPMQKEFSLSDTDLHMSGLIVSAIITSAFRAWLDAGKKEPIDQIYDRVISTIQHIQ